MFLQQVVALIIIFCSLVVAAGPGRTTYQAKIIKPDNQPLEAINVNFKFTILNPLGDCVLYSETHSGINMTGTGGLVSFNLGSGIKVFPAGARTFEEVFSNITPSLSCDTGGPVSYTPAASDTRKVLMQFQDGSGWQTLPPMDINAVPYAMYATSADFLGGVSATSFVRDSEITSCPGQALTFNGTSFSCIAVSSGGSSPVSAAAITTALGYTPADSASYTTLVSNVNNLNSAINSVSGAVSTISTYVTAVSATTYSVSTSVSSLSGTVTSLTSSIANLSAAVSSIISSQWISSGTNLIYNSGNVGIGTSYPVTRFEVSGGIRIANETAACSPALAGTLRYNFGVVEYCDGGSWSAFGVSGAGLMALNGLTSGSQIFSNGTNGLQPNFSSAGSTHTLNIPLASAGSVVAGLISNADYSFFMSKINSSPAAIEQVLGYVPANNATVLTATNGLIKNNNLSDIVSASAARTNLGLGNLATLNNVDLSTTQATGILNLARLPSFTGDVSSVSGSNFLVLNNSGVVAGTYAKVTVDSKGRITSGQALTNSDVVTALGFTPHVSGVGVTQWLTSGTTISYSNGNVGIGTANPETKLEVRGTSGTTLKIVDGHQAEGRVLASDANGNASWQTPKIYGQVCSSGQYLQGFDNNGNKVCASTLVSFSDSAQQGGGSHHCAIMSDSTIACWGLNSTGQLGNNTLANQPIGTFVRKADGSKLSAVTSLALSWANSCAVTNGEVYCWGDNAYYQGGIGTTVDTLLATKVSGISNAVQVSGGTYHTCARLSDGTVKCWGLNDNGQLGDNSVVTRTTPVQVLNASGTANLSGVTHISSGSKHTCAIISGAAFCWGDNAYGALGDSTTVDKRLPVQVTSLSSGIIDLTGSLAYYYDGSASSWRSHSCAVKADGTVWCWGRCGDRQCGYSSTPLATVVSPTQVLWDSNYDGINEGPLTGVVSVSLGALYSCALKSNGTAACWGNNVVGQLGDGTVTTRAFAVPMTGVGGTGILSNIRGIALNGQYNNGANTATIVILNDGNAVGFGGNQRGQIGDNSVTTRTVPVGLVQP